MNLDELQSVRDRERQTDKLQQLRESFYADAGGFIQQLRDERERAAERADDPFDAPEVSQLSDEIDTAEQTVEAIYEKRVGKIVKAASFAAADLPTEVDGMTAEEQVLFDSLVEEIRRNRERVLDVLAGEDVGDQAASAGSDPDVSAADLMGGGPTADATDRDPAAGDQPGETTSTGAQPAAGADSGGTSERHPPPPEAEARSPGVEQPSSEATAATGTDATPEPVGSHEEPPGEPTTTRDSSDPGPEHPVRKDGGATGGSGQGIERETVRVTEDVDTFVGFDDRDYDLGRDDVVTLPATNAQLLVDQDAAEPLE